ncbi:AMP-binding protein [Sphingomonas oryzagri]
MTDWSHSPACGARSGPENGVSRASDDPNEGKEGIAVPGVKPAVESFTEARNLLLEFRTDYATAVEKFRWPPALPFNWASDWFDGVLANDASIRDQAALRFIDVDLRETSYSFAEMSERSNRVVNYLREAGVGRGDHILLVVGNVVELWDVMLAAIKMNAVVIPATPLLTSAEIADRIERGGVQHVIAEHAQLEKFEELPLTHVHTRICADGHASGWTSLGDAHVGERANRFVADGPTAPDEPMLLYFTSGTTQKPKLVVHTHRSYPVGALSTMYWIGLTPGDQHLNISSPGWAKHAWSSLFAPWCAGATIVILNQPRFDPHRLLKVLSEHGITTMCAPPTVWRMLIQADITRYDTSLRELCSAGEPLNPEVIAQVQAAWNLTIRDGFGQTESTAQIGNTPGQPLKIGSMGRSLPGYRHMLLGADGSAGEEGEICLALDESRPAGLMAGYRLGNGQSVINDEVYRTGDIAARDSDGYLTFVGRADDVFKSSDYRISPFELESVLLEHPAVAEGAVVPSPDPVRLAVPKAFVILVEGVPPSRETAQAVLDHARTRLAPYKRIRLIEFVEDLPKTISGKIKRADLRRIEEADYAAGRTAPYTNRHVYSEHSL